MIGTVKATKTLQQVVQNGPEALRIPAAHASLVAAERLAQSGNISSARSVMESVIRSLPPGHLQTVASNAYEVERERSIGQSSITREAVNVHADAGGRPCLEPAREQSCDRASEHITRARGR